MNNAVVGPILTDLVRVVAAAALTYGVAWIKAHLSARQLATAIVIGNKVVGDAEQVAKEMGWDGPAKLKAALAGAAAFGKRFGVRLSGAQWRSLIEGAVRELEPKKPAMKAKAASKTAGMPATDAATKVG